MGQVLTGRPANKYCRAITLESPLYLYSLENGDFTPEKIQEPLPFAAIILISPQKVTALIALSAVAGIIMVGSERCLRDESRGQPYVRQVTTYSRIQPATSVIRI